MVLDYSKWDALELSDDSDFEPHPNVDKRSFIRAKQNQIHQQRYERRHQIETLKYERIINDGLLRRIDALLGELQHHESEAKDRNAFIYQALITSAGDPDEDKPPRPPGSVHSKEEPIRYSQMIGSLVDQVKKEVDDSKTDNWYDGYMKGINGHRAKVVGMQTELLTKLAELEKEESRKITSDNIHDGFNSSSVTKEKAAPTKKGTALAETVEVLNPASLKKGALIRQDSTQSSGADADIDEKVTKPLADSDDETVEASALGKQFAKIKMGDYQQDIQFISQHREVLEERETDGLLVMAFDAQLKGNAQVAQQCVHQALLLQYCRTLGRDGVGLFFKRITTPGHEAQRVFHDDVRSTYQRIKTRTAEIVAERDANPSEVEVERIQLQAVEPGTDIHVNIPHPDSTETVEKQARAIFETFPPGLQRAMESGSLEKVNEVLGKMSVEEAEEVVGQMGEYGMLDMRQGVIDGSTEEGQEQIRLLKGQAAKDDEAAELLTAQAGGVEIADPE